MLSFCPSGLVELAFAGRSGRGEAKRDGDSSSRPPQLLNSAFLFGVGGWCGEMELDFSSSCWRGRGNAAWIDEKLF